MIVFSCTTVGIILVKGQTASLAVLENVPTCIINSSIAQIMNHIQLIFCKYLLINYRRNTKW